MSKQTDLRYWGYEPSIAENMNSGYNPDRKAHREQYKKDCIVIKASGFKPTQYGLNKGDAIAWRQQIENTTGIPIRIFQHDYL